MNITIVGTGNLAWNLAKTFYNEGIEIKKIIARDTLKAKYLANEIGCEFGNIENEKNNQTAYFLCVSDNSIEQVASKFNNNFLVHCSGATNIDVLAKHTSNYGVFYPLYSFPKHQLANFEHIPIFLEASNNRNLNVLEHFAQKISPKVYFINSKQRLIVHLSAVFSNNFVNHLFSITNKILNDYKIDFEVLLPIIQKTLSIENIKNALENQTGPAIRKDFSTIEKHLETLKFYNKDFEKVYKTITDSIISLYEKKNL